MIVTHRRWNRLSKVQYEVHNKLLDRFTSNEDLLAYVQTPAGRRFLESAPIPMQDEAPMLSAPFSRILWSVQAGIVLTIAGIGLLYVSSRFIDEPAQFFMVIGVLARGARRRLHRLRRGGLCAVAKARAAGSARYPSCVT